MSDLHLDAADHDREALLTDLKAARKLGARITINGDIFDAIMPSDRKRHHPKVSENNQRDDILNHLVNMAADILEPYADLIDVIAPGNHERAVLKYHHFDMISALISILNRARPKDMPPIHQGSYRGFQKYVWTFAKGKKQSPGSRSLTLFRHHGRGGSAPVTGGAIDLYRLRQDFDADIYWIGHKHNQMYRKYTRVSLGPKGRLQVRPQRAVMSAGYKRQILEEDPEADGDVADFGEQFYSVSEQGAVWITVDVATQPRTTSTGYVYGMRWTVADQPATQ
jgi:hypothetical protein